MYTDRYTLGWSEVYSFQTFTNDFSSYANLNQSFLLIGDMGYDPEAPDTIARLKAIGTWFVTAVKSVIF